MLYARCLVLIPLLATFAPLFGAEEPATYLNERGKLLFSDDLDKQLGKDWRPGKGKWENVNGVLTGAELKEDKHRAYMHHKRTFRNVVIQFFFKLDGANQITLNLDKDKNHLGRVAISPTEIFVQKDDTDREGPDKRAVLDTKKLTIKPGEWHTVVFEVRDKEILACLDGTHIVFGAHEALDLDKVDFGFTVAGASASFKQVRLWEGMPNKNWEATKARLLAERGKASTPAKP